MQIIDNITDKLFTIKQKKELEKELQGLESQYKLTRKFPEYGSSEDENAQEVEKIQENLGLQQNLKNLIRDTKVALKKIDNNKYGLCEVCKGEIDTNRLKAYPSASMCVSCANKRTRTRR